MSNYVATSSLKLMTVAMKKVTELANIDDTSDTLESVIIAGAVKAGGRWIDFSVRADQSAEGRVSSTHFVNESKSDKLATALAATINDYYEDAAGKLTSWSSADMEVSSTEVIDNLQ